MHERFREDLYREIWGEAAGRLSAQVVDLSNGFLEIRRAQARTRVSQRHVSLDSALVVLLCSDKVVARRLLSQAGVPAPDQLEYERDQLEQALEFMQADSRPCVVKPTGSRGGEGVITGVRTAAELARASARAARTSSRLVIERQLLGDVYRMLFLDGELLDTVRRRSPRVIGDGHSDIGQLVHAENRRRLEQRGRAGLVALRLDWDAIFTLREAGMTPRSVPAPGTPVTVKTVTNQNRIEDNETVREGLSEELVAEAARAVRVLGVRLAGVDLIAMDPSRSLKEGQGAILEVNAAPGLHHHYLVADASAATPVAVPVLERLLGSGG